MRILPLPGQLTRQTLWLTAIAIFVFSGLSTQPAWAEVTTVDIAPSWNAGATRVEDPDTFNSVYACEIGIDNTLFSYTDPDFGEWSRIGLQFDLSAIPASATITNVELQVNVRFPTSAIQTVRRAMTDDLEQLDCTGPDTFTSLQGVGSVYNSFGNWNTSGLKTLNLGGVAVNDVQSRTLGNQIYGLSIVSNGDIGGAISAVTEPNTAKRPRLRITFSTTPGAPTGFILTGRSATSLTWSWMENGWAETYNLVRNELAQDRCDAGPRSGISNSVSCTETGLTPNTLYTRHATAVDPEGVTNGPDVAISTAIETPTSITVTGISQNTVNLYANGALTNLQRAFSGLKYFESYSGQHSGWSQTNAGWTFSGFLPNTPLTLSAQARNGDGVETPSSPAATIYTYAVAPQVAAHRSTRTWYATPDFSFSNAVSWGTGGVQYYRWAWTTSATYSFNGSEPTWSSAHWRCPGESCAVAAETLTNGASHNQAWYLHVQGFNGDQVHSGAAIAGPFYYDATVPSAPSKVTFADLGNTKLTNTWSPLTANWLAATDTVSGIREYQYAVGTWPGGTDVRGFTSIDKVTKVTITGLKLKNGKKYYLSIRAVDVAGQAGPAAVSNGLLTNTIDPAVFDRQTGDPQHRRLSGTKYNVDFRRAATGPKLAHAQYTVYTKASLGGQRAMGWTRIFNGARDSFTDNWSVNFPGLREGVNYVSVRVTGTDGRSTVARDVFTIMKDTSPAPSIKGLYQATFSRQQPTQELLIIGKGFKPGAQVYVGSLRASRVRLNKFGQLQARVSINRLQIGRYTLRVVNPNGLDASRVNKVFIISG